LVGIIKDGTQIFMMGQMGYDFFNT
jgi:hypothetical protein